MKRTKLDLAVTIALIPILGSGLVLLSQLGQLTAFGLPPDFLDLNPSAILLSSMAMAFLALALFFMASLNYDIVNSLQGYKRFFGWLAISLLASIALWHDSISMTSPASWLTIVAVVLIAATLFWIERWLSIHHRKTIHEQLAGWALTGFVVILVVAAGAFAHGYNMASKKTEFHFLKGTNLALIIRTGDLLVFEPYNEETREFDTTNIKVMTVDGSIDLVRRKIKRQ